MIVNVKNYATTPSQIHLKTIQNQSLKRHYQQQQQQLRFHPKINVMMNLNVGCVGISRRVTIMVL
jgi:hypothetical protein